MLMSCPREKEVKALVERGQWPLAWPADLLAHANECRICSDLVLVTGVFRHARAQAGAPRHAVSPGMLWWRAQLRRRNEAMERLERPALAAYFFALGLMLVLTTAFLVAQARQDGGWLAQLKSLAGRALNLPALWTAALSGSGAAWTIISALLTCVLIAATTVYLAIDRT